MKTFQQLREELESLSELSTALLKRYKKKSDAQSDAYYSPNKQGDRKTAIKRMSGSDRASAKIKGNKKDIKVPASGGMTAADNKKAKTVAHGIAKAHKNLKVTSVGSDHFIHHKDDQDGHEHIHVTHASTGKVHVSHEYGTTSGSKKTMSHSDALKHGHAIVKGSK